MVAMETNSHFVVNEELMAGDRSFLFVVEMKLWPLKVATTYSSSAVCHMLHQTVQIPWSKVTCLVSLFEISRNIFGQLL